MSSMFNPPRADRTRAGWDSRALRSVLTPRAERNRADLPLLTVARERGVFVRSTDDANHNSIPEDLSNYKVAHAGDLVINKMKAWQGSLGLAPVDGIVSPAYFVFEADFTVVKFGEYLLRSAPYVAEFGAASDGVRIGQWDLNIPRMKNIRVSIPPAEEQAAIVKYLAHANARIDKAITAKRHLSALFRESRNASIDALVLGRGRPNKAPSDAPWLGMIPREWAWRRCRTLTTYISSGSRGWAEFYADVGALFLQSGNLGRSLELKLAGAQRVRLPADATEGLRTRVKPNDLLVCITGALTGNVALVPASWSDEAYVNQHVALVRPNSSEVVPEFLAYALKSLPSQIQFRGSEYGGTKQGLGLDEVKNVEVLLPPHSDQQEVVERIREVTSVIDSAIARVEGEIALVREFRTRLVADVVTGQVDVREIAACLPDAPDPVDTLTVAPDDELDDAVSEGEK